MSGQVDKLLKRRFDLVWIGAVFGLVYWGWQSYRDAFLLEKTSFIQSLIFPDIISLAMRLVVISVLLLFCIHAQYLQEKFLEDKTPRSRQLGVFAFVISAVGFVMLYWILDSFQDILIQSKVDIVERVLTPGLSILVSRSLSVLFLIILVFLVQYLLVTKKKAEKILKTAHDQLAKSRENLNKIVTNDMDAVFVIDHAGKVVFVNPASERMFQKPVYELVGSPLNYQISTESSQEIEIVNEAGKSFCVEALGVDIEWQGEQAILVSFRDITERKRVERIRQHFLSLISHRLKSPVVGIMGAIENMLDGLTGTISEKQREYLLVMKENITLKFYLIEDLLTSLRLEAKGEMVQIDDVVLVDVIERSIKKFRPMIKEKGLELNLDGIDTKLIVRADSKKLEKVIQNILHNAVKFTTKGSIAIEAAPDGNLAIISITDSGKGMSDATLKTIFQMEKQLQSLADANIGMGFGLYIAKKFMQLQEGDILASSTLGQGSCLSILIPRHH